MSLSSGASGGKGIDANPVETYDSGDEWDIGVGNLIIDLDADLEKDQQKLEMSGSKEVGLPAPNAVATLPDNIKFVSPVPGPQGKEGKSKSKRSKSGKDSGKPTPGTSLFTPSEGAGGKKEAQGRSGDGANSGNLVPAVTPKGSEKSAKASRSVAGSKKEKEGGSSKSKKERSEGAGAAAEKEPSVLQPLALAVRVGQYDGGQGTEPAAAEQLGSIAIDTGAALNPLGVKSELEDGENECRQLKKVKSEKVRKASGCGWSGVAARLWRSLLRKGCATVGDEEAGAYSGTVRPVSLRASTDGRLVPPGSGARMVWLCDVLASGCSSGRAPVEPCMASGNRAPANHLRSLCVRVPSCRTLGDLVSLVLRLCRAGPSLSNSCRSVGGAWAGGEGDVPVLCPLQLPTRQGSLLSAVLCFLVPSPCVSKLPAAPRRIYFFLVASFAEKETLTC